MAEEKKQTFDGILDWDIIKTHQIKEFTPEQNKDVVRVTRNFEKAHLKAYLKGYTHFTFHGRVYEVKRKTVEE